MIAKLQLSSAWMSEWERESEIGGWCFLAWKLRALLRSLLTYELVCCRTQHFCPVVQMSCQTDDSDSGLPLRVLADTEVMVCESYLRNIFAQMADANTPVFIIWLYTYVAVHVVSGSAQSFFLAFMVRDCFGTVWVAFNGLWNGL